ncbi:hypothetical protein ACO1O0_008566 [Amphichorda felina]
MSGYQVPDKTASQPGPKDASNTRDPSRSRVREAISSGKQNPMTMAQFAITPFARENQNPQNTGSPFTPTGTGRDATLLDELQDSNLPGMDEEMQPTNPNFDTFEAQLPGDADYSGVEIWDQPPLDFVLDMNDAFDLMQRDDASFPDRSFDPILGLEDPFTEPGTFDPTLEGAAPFAENGSFGPMQGEDPFYTANTAFNPTMGAAPSFQDIVPIDPALGGVGGAGKSDDTEMPDFAGEPISEEARQEHGGNEQGLGPENYAGNTQMPEHGSSEEGLETIFEGVESGSVDAPGEPDIDWTKAPSTEKPQNTNAPTAQNTEAPTAHTTNEQEPPRAITSMAECIMASLHGIPNHCAICQGKVVRSKFRREGHQAAAERVIGAFMAVNAKFGRKPKIPQSPQQSPQNPQ